MSEPAASTACRNCGQHREGELPDRAGWCRRCREQVVRRADPVARAAGIATAGVLLVVIVLAGGLESRFLVLWLAGAALLSLLVFKVARRVAFDVYRGRGVPPPEQD